MRRTVSAAKPCSARREQHGLHGWSQIDENPDEAAGPREFHRLPQRGNCSIGFPLHLERQSAQGQDFDLEADAEGALGNLDQRIQDVKRRLHIRVRASCQKDAGLRQVRVLQPEQ